MSSLTNPPEDDAQKHGQIVVKPGPYDLFIDIDSDEDRRTFYKMLRILQNNGIDAQVLRDEASKSGLPHRHIYVHVPVLLSAIERVALQAALGSDRTRELLSVLRVWEGRKATRTGAKVRAEITVFFEAPGFEKPEPKAEEE